MIVKHFTVMLWLAKNELRVINLQGTCGAPFAEFAYLPEHKDKPPLFETADQGWDFIRLHHPELSP